MDDLKRLSKADKIKILEIVESKDRAARRAKPFYKPHAGQLAIHMSDKRQRVCTASNSFGKTAAVVQEAWAAATGYNPWRKVYTKVPAYIIFVIDSGEKISEKILPEFSKWFDMSTIKMEKAGHPYIKYLRFTNGSVIQFMLVDAEPMKFEGGDGYDYILTDEPFPRHIYVSLYRGTRSKGSDPKLLIVGTPIAAPWLRTDLYEPWSRGEMPNLDWFFGRIEDNKENLREGYIEEFSAILTEKEKRTRLEGQFFDLDGLALAGVWDRKTHIIPLNKQKDLIQPDWPAVVVVDPHPRKSHVAIILVVNPDGEMFIVKEMASRAVPSKFALDLAAFAQDYRVVDVVCDSLGSSELTGGHGNLSFISVVNNVWAEEDVEMRMRATTYKEKDDEGWLSMIQEALVIPIDADNFGRRQPKLRVFEQCRGTIFDIENAAWYRTRNDAEVLKPKIDMTKRDYLSCVKYGLAAQPSMFGRRRIMRTAAKSPWSGAPVNHGEREGDGPSTWYNKVTSRRGMRKDWEKF